MQSCLCTSNQLHSSFASTLTREQLTSFHASCPAPDALCMCQIKRPHSSFASTLTCEQLHSFHASCPAPKQQAYSACQSINQPLQEGRACSKRSQLGCILALGDFDLKGRLVHQQMMMTPAMFAEDAISRTCSAAQICTRANLPMGSGGCLHHQEYPCPGVSKQSYRTEAVIARCCSAVACLDRACVCIFAQGLVTSEEADAMSLIGRHWFSR